MIQADFFKTGELLSGFRSADMQDMMIMVMISSVLR